MLNIPVIKGNINKALKVTRDLLKLSKARS